MELTSLISDKQRAVLIFLGLILYVINFATHEHVMRFFSYPSQSMSVLHVFSFAFPFSVLLKSFLVLYIFRRLLSVLALAGSQTDPVSTIYLYCYERSILSINNQSSIIS